MQLGTTVSGVRDLVTGPLAGAGVGSDDIDGGATTIRSPNIVLPGSGDLRLSFSFYLAYLSNSSADDYLRVSVVGPSGPVAVFEERGAAAQRNASWAQATVGLNGFAGQTVYLVIAAADAAGASLVEAAIDDIAIAAGASDPTPQPPSEAIANSDFEQGFVLMGGGYIATGWGEWESRAGDVTGYDEPVVVHGGAHSQRLRVWSAGGGSGGVYQRVPVTSGVSYAVSVQARAFDTLSFCSLGVDPAGGTDPRSGVVWSSTSNSVAWVQRSWAGTATSNTITIYFRAASADGGKRNCYFDDVTLLSGPGSE
jgi:hypothetical protein